MSCHPIHPTDFQGSVIDALREAIEQQIQIHRPDSAAAGDISIST
jgi:hypothetical protein